MGTADLELRRTFYFLGSLMLIGALLYWAQPVLIPLAIAILWTFILTPVVGRLERWGLPRFLASAIAVLGVAIVFIGIGNIFGSMIQSVARQPELRGELQGIQWLGFALTEAVVFYGLLGSILAYVLV